MKRTAKECPTLAHDIYKTVLYDKKEPVLTVCNDIFQFAGRSLPRATRRINAHYRFFARRLEGLSRRTLYRRAVAAHKKGGSEGFVPHMLSVKHKVTYNKGNLLSLYHDHIQNDGQARPAVCRMADTWRLSDGVPMTLKDVCGTRKTWRLLRRLTVTEDRRLLESGQASFLTRSADGKRRRFGSSRFYLTDQGVVIFEEAGRITSTSQGVQTIVVPYQALSLSL